jgi:hypothetical protein
MGKSGRSVTALIKDLLIGGYRAQRKACADVDLATFSS